MRQKLITLCPNSWEIASKKPNFSKWVRDRLMKDNDMMADIDFLSDQVEMWKESARKMSDKYHSLKIRRKKID